MELFAAAGIDLPSSGAASRKTKGRLNLLRTPLLNHKVVQRARERAAFAPSEAEMRLAAEYARKITNPNISAQNESTFSPVFIRDVLIGLLGYRTADPGEEYSIAEKRAVRRGFVDIALGRFNDGDGPNQIIAPFEMKGPEYADLDRIMPGRGRSPVQQAWDYANDAPGTRWVLVSNCVEIRLYAYGRGRDAYEVFDLAKLDQPEEHARLWLLLSAGRLIGGETDRLLQESDSEAKLITNQLYHDYKGLRDKLLAFLMDSADGPKLNLQQAIEAAQKTLDRVLFVAFCQRRDLLPEDILKRVVASSNEWDPKPIWINFRGMFRKVDKGDFDRRIPAYNGGLFAPDPLVDSLVIPDPLATDIAKLGDWDYRSEVPVTVLGHIFEQSITDIESLRAQARGETPPDGKQGKKKKEGVVYTPDMVTRFLVEQTIGRTLAERRAALAAVHDMATEEGERAYWRGYLAALRALTVLDPACGSGAFLVAAFKELREQYLAATDRLEALGDRIDFDPLDEIVTKNLYGVDLNAESAEITRLSLWLETARRERRLQNLEATIKAGNSLISDRKYTDRPFDWNEAYPEVMKAGGFDIVIGNPPYVRHELIKAIKPYLKEKYDAFDSSADLYCYFFERAIKHLVKDCGRVGFIVPCGFLKTSFGNKIRNIIDNKTIIESVVDFGDSQVFDDVTTYPNVFTLKKNTAGGQYKIRAFQRMPPYTENLSAEFETGSFEYPSQRLKRARWHFEPEEFYELRNKIERKCKNLLSSIGTPLSGIKTGSTKVFVIADSVKRDLTRLNRNADRLFRNWTSGDDTARWASRDSSESLIFIPKGWTKSTYGNLKESELWSSFKRDFPSISQWFETNREKLESRSDKGDFW